MPCDQREVRHAVSPHPAISCADLFGKYSYAAYLFHFPLNILIRDFVFNPASATNTAGQLILQVAFYLASAVGTLGLAWLSWNLMEKHFLKLKNYFPSPAAASPTYSINDPVVPDGPRPITPNALPPDIAPSLRVTCSC